VAYERAKPTYLVQRWFRWLRGRHCSMTGLVQPPSPVFCGPWKLRWSGRWLCGGSKTLPRTPTRVLRRVAAGRLALLLLQDAGMSGGTYTDNHFLALLFLTRLATNWTVRGSNPGKGEVIFCTPDRIWGPPSLMWIR